MNERKVIRFSILIFWTFFWGLSVVDKIVPAVNPYWVGKDFFALFIKFFASLGIKDPIYATTALAIIAALEVLNFTLYLFAIVNFSKGKSALAERWLFRAVFSSIVLFGLFSIADQTFGDRFQLLEHGIFWLILIASWLVFKHISNSEERFLKFKFSNDIKFALVVGVLLTVLTSISIIQFSNDTFSNAVEPVEGEEVVEGVYKFDFPFLADKVVFENTVNTFKEEHPELEITYIYTGPSELNTKKKTHMLLYIFTEQKESI